MRFRKKVNTKAVSNRIQDNLAYTVASRILQLQRYVSRCLNQKAQTLPPGTVKAWLLLFCLGSGSFNLYLTGRVFLKAPSKNPLSIGAIQVPKLLRKEDEKWRSKPLRSERDYQNLWVWKADWDSLRHVKSKSGYDRIIKKHPARKDSISSLRK